MRARKWKVKFVKEMLPKSKSLLGLNYNYGEKIMLKLRKDKSTKKLKRNEFFKKRKRNETRNDCRQNIGHDVNEDKNIFLPYYVILDSLLHELAHMEHGNHSAEFYDLWVSRYG